MLGVGDGGWGGCQSCVPTVDLAGYSIILQRLVLQRVDQSGCAVVGVLVRISRPAVPGAGGGPAVWVAGLVQLLLGCAAAAVHAWCMGSTKIGISGDCAVLICCRVLLRSAGKWVGGQAGGWCAAGCFYAVHWCSHGT